MSELMHAVEEIDRYFRSTNTIPIKRASIRLAEWIALKAALFGTDDESQARFPALTGCAHELKSWPRSFADVKAGIKPFEVRLNDRDFKLGDVLNLREWDPEVKTFTGDTCRVRVNYLTDWDQKPGYVVMAVSRLRHRDEEVPLTSAIESEAA